MIYAYLYKYSFYIVLRGNLSALVDTSSLQRMFYSSNDNEKRAFQGFNGLPLSHLRALSKKERITTIRHAHSNEVWRMSTGDYFGEDSLIMREGKTLYSVRSLDHVELLVIDGSDFDEVLKPYFHQVFFERIKLLYSMGLFHNCSIMSVRLLVHMLRESNYHLGECLFRQNMKCDSISIIAEGSVKLSSDSCQKTPPDLLEKIRPPKDHLGDILMEGKPKGGAKNMGNSTQHGSRGISKGRHATALSAVTVRSKVSSLSVRSSRKASGSRKKKVDQSDYEMMGFVLHQPSTHSPNVHICTLVQGDILGDIESRAKLTRHLFSAVCVSSTTIYEIKTSVFEAIMHKRLGTMAHQMVERCIQKVEAWQSSHPTIPFFPPLSTVLTQIIGDLEEDGAHKLVRNPPKNETPESLAMACINGLDFKIPDTNSEMSDEDFVPEMNYLSDGDSISSDILSQFGFSSEANMGDAEAKDPDMVVQKSSSERSANSSMEEPTSLAEAAALDADLTYYPPLHETRAMKERKKRLYSFDAAVPFGKHTFNSNKPLSIPSPVHENAYEHFESQGQDRAKLNTNIEQPHHGGPDEYGNRQTGFKDKNADGCGKLSLAKIRYDVKYNKEQSLKKRDSFNLMTTDFVRSGLIRPLHKLIPDLPQASFATRVVPVRIPSGREAERIKGTGSSLSIDAKFEPVNEITQVRSSSKQVRGDCLKDTSATTIRHSSDGSIKVLTLELEM